MQRLVSHIYRDHGVFRHLAGHRRKNCSRIHTIAQVILFPTAFFFAPDRKIESNVLHKEHAKRMKLLLSLYQSLGFREWEISYAISQPTEVYVKLEEFQ
jgi:hypothetical protein